MSILDNRVALVTGGSRGIGRDAAIRLGRAGAHVAIGFQSKPDDARAVVAAVEAEGRKAIAARANVADPAEVGAMVEQVTRALGPIDILVSNAGISRAASLDTLDLALWDETMAVNLRSAFLVSHAVVPGMRKRRWGRLIYMSSTAARFGGIVGPHYAASKAGLEGMMHGYASLLAKEGITANAIAPALIKTDMIAGVAAADPARLPVGRLGEANEVSSLVVELARNGYITGQTIQVNGGVYMT